MNENLTDDMKKSMEKTKQNIEKYSKEINKEFGKKILGTAILPPQKEAKNKNEISILILSDIAKEKDAFKEREKLIKVTNQKAEKIDKNIKPYVLDVWELRENCFDSKYEILDSVAKSAILSDKKDLLKAVKIAEVHKQMTLKKFEKYIVSYVAVGSLFRGDATSHDIDVAVVIDDTDVKKMTRAELKDKLRAIIYDMGRQASMITGVKKQFHIQTYILTDFWDSLKDAQPVVYTFLRDGVPLYDRGVFMPWKLLLRMGRIRPSPEAIDMQMDVGERLIKRTKGKLLSIIGEDLYYAILNPAQAALMLYGIAPPTPKETIKLMNDIFVKKEKLLEKKYVDMLAEIRKYYKDIEHGTIKDVKGKDIDRLLKNAEEYFKRINKLFNQIQKKSNKKSITDINKTAETLVKDVLKEEGKTPGKNPLTQFKKHFVDTKKMPAKVLEDLKEIKQAKEKFQKNNISYQELEKVRRQARQTIKYLVEYMDRKKHYALQKAKIRFRYEEKTFGEVLLLEDIAFIIHDITKPTEGLTKAKVDKNGKMSNIKKATPQEFEKHLTSAKIPKQVLIKEKTFENLKELFGKDVEILLNY